MALEKQNVSYDFGKGLSEAIDPDLVVDGSVLKVKNGVYNQAGRVDKRDGYEVLSKEVLIPGAATPIRPLQGVTGIHDHNGNLAASEATQVLSYNESRDIWTESGGFYRACKLNKSDLVGCDYDIMRSASAENQDIKVVVFEAASHAVGYKVIDKKSNTTLFLTYDVNMELVGGRYADVDDGGADNARQYTEPMVVEQSGKFFIFMVRDRYNTKVGKVNPGLVPDVRIPATATPGTGVNEYPELVMFGLSLVNYQLTTAGGGADYLIRFDIGDYNNFPHHDGGPGNFNDHSYCSYDVKVPKTALGQPTQDDYIVVALSGIWIARLYTVRVSTSTIADHEDVVITGNPVPFPSVGGTSECNFIVVGQSSDAAALTSWRVWNWQWDGGAPANECFFSLYDIDPDGLISLGPAQNVACVTFDNPNKPWSDYNPLTESNIIGTTQTNIYTVTSALKIYELTAAATGGAPADPGWSESALQIPQRVSALTNPFIYYKDPTGATDLEKYGLAIGVTPDLEDLKINFLYGEGGRQNVICKYSSGTASEARWGVFFNEIAGGLPYNSRWDLVVGAFPGPYDISAVVPTLMWSLPRSSPLVSQSVTNGPYDKALVSTIETIQAQVEDGEISSDGRVRELGVSFADGVSADFLSFSTELYMNGGYLAVFDNNVIVENNFHLPPVILTITNEGGTRWKYRSIYEWIDDTGNLHRSEPSPFVVTDTDPSGGTGTDLGIIAPIVTGKKAHDISIAVYRTEDSGDVYYRVSKLTPPVGPVAPSSTTEDNRHINPNVLGETIDFKDVLLDADIVGNEILYTTGGILSNVSPPSMNVIAEHDGRIFGSGLDNPNVIYYSKIKRPNTSVEFSELLTLDVPPEGGQITGLNSLDGNLIIFKEDKVYRMYGEGPADTGANSSYSRPTLISSSHGAVTDKAIINTIYGIVFRGTDGGIYLLDRSLVFKYIGAPVEDSNDLEIVHATNLGVDNEVRFILENGEALVYNYWFQQWSRFTNHTSVDSTVWKDKFVMARVDDSKGIWVQDRTSYLDVTEPIFLDVETAWIKVAGIKGFQRCNWLSILGEQTDAHDVEVSLYRDYNDAPVETFTVDGADIFDLKFYGDPSCGTYGSPLCGPYGWPGDDVYQWRHKPRIQKCESIKLNIKDKAEISGVYDPNIATNFSLKNVTLYIGVKKGQFKLPERKTV